MTSAPYAEIISDQILGDAVDDKLKPAKAGGLMKWAKNFIRNWQKPEKPVIVGPQVAVDQSLQFTSHTDFVEEAFTFLRHDFGFPLPSSSWHSREHYTVYQNQSAKIEIGFESNTLPHVVISRGAKESTEYECWDIACLDAGGVIRSIHTSRSARFEPKLAKYLDKIMHDNTYDGREMDDDYSQWGRSEHQELLLTYAKLVKQNQEILGGDFSNFPVLDQSGMT